MEPEKNRSIWREIPRKGYLEVVADKLIKTHVKLEKLKDKRINSSFLNLF
jgi:hypothetical protein